MNLPSVKATVEETLPELRFRLTIDETGKEIVAYLSGKMRLNKIKVVVGDRVDVILDPLGGKITNRIIRRL